MHLTIDFETRSQADLKNGGSRRYAEDPTTQVMCLAILVDGRTPMLHIPDWVLQKHPGIELGFPYLTLGETLALIEKAEHIEAHNAEFEKNIFQYCYPKKELPLAKLHCSAAKAAMHALPRALGNACDAMQTHMRKDNLGYSVMMRMCKPRKPLKADKERDPDWETKVYWNESLEDFIALFKYCIQDVWSEHAFSAPLRDLPESERKIWILDQKINDRGVMVSIPDIQNLQRLVTSGEAQMLAEFKDLTNDSCTPKQVAKVLDILRWRGVYIDDLRKETLLAYLAENDDIDPVAERLMQIRLGTAKSSTAKFVALQKMVLDNSRVHGLLLYHGADTGRWAGQKVQPQNLPSRNVLKAKLVEHALADLAKGATSDYIELVYGPPLWVASSCLRSCFIAPRGKDLIAADYSAIEGRVLAWLAGEQFILDAYENGVDTYILAAAGIYHCTPEEVKPEQRQIGKVVELACGYQGGSNAFIKMGQTYGIRVPVEDAKRIVSEWREYRPATKQYWSDLEAAAVRAIKNPGQIVRVRNVSWKYGNITISGAAKPFLCCRLPSGRMLHYPFAHLAKKKLPWGEREVDEIRFMGVDPTSKRWVQQSTYGGKLAENITQAVSRDLLAEAMLRLEATGKYEIVLHVHDESIAEVNEGEGDLEEFTGIMNELPEWAAGLPIKAAGWIGKRYKK